jgi:hypothetical protein
VDTALHVFDDPYHVTTQDREVDGEPRWQTIGMAERTTCYWLRTQQTGRTTQYGLFPPGKQLVQNGEFMPKATRKSKTEVRRRRIPGQTLTSRQRRELAALAAMPDDQIDTSDIPELPPNAWKDAIRGRFYRP